MRRFSSLCVFKCVLKLTALTDSVVYNWYGFGFHSYETWFGEECVAGLTAAVNLGDPPPPPLQDFGRIGNQLGWPAQRTEPDIVTLLGRADIAPVQTAP